MFGRRMCTQEERHQRAPKHHTIIFCSLLIAIYKILEVQDGQTKRLPTEFQCFLECLEYHSANASSHLRLQSCAERAEKSVALPQPQPWNSYHWAITSINGWSSLWICKFVFSRIQISNLQRFVFGSSCRTSM